MNHRITSTLQSIEISHSFAMNYKHGVEMHGKWDSFEPTRFVYAFFAYNMIYAIDWKLTTKKDWLNYQRASSENYAKDQFLSLIDFVFTNDNKAFENALEVLDKNRELYSVVSTMEEDYNSSRKSNRNTGNTIAHDFLMASKKFFDRIDLIASDHFDLLQMSYTVRNNLFHGEKKAQQMREKGHRNRLLHYGNIILATNESFFEVMKHHFGYNRVENWEVQDNV
jgi:hypothetical protein